MDIGSKVIYVHIQDDCFSWRFTICNVSQCFGMCSLLTSTWEGDSHSVCNMTLFCLQTLDNFCLITNLLNFEKTSVQDAFASSRRITLRFNRRTTGRIPNAWEFLKVLTPFKITPKTQGTPSWMGVNLTQLFFQCSNVCWNSRLRICLSIGHSNPTSFKSVAGWSGVGISDGTIHGIWLLLVSFSIRHGWKATT